jgi:hypothetical protein
MIVELLKSAGKELPVGPGYSNDHNSFLNGKAIHFNFCSLDHNSTFVLCSETIVPDWLLSFSAQYSIDI